MSCRKTLADRTARRNDPAGGTELIRRPSRWRATTGASVLVESVRVGYHC